MTHPPPDPLREALDTIHQIIADAKKERDRYGYIAATIRVNALRAGASDEETEAMVRGDKPFIDWLAKQYEAKRLEDAAAPQPAPAPAADERAEIERIICDAFTCDLRGRGDEDGAFWQTAADALLAAGYRKADALLAERDAAQAEAARLTAALAEAETRVWQPIETAPKEREHEYSGCGPMIALASDFGHRAVGYWGKGRNGIEGWINPHDHLLMDYWNRFSWWMPLSEPPLPPHERDGQEDQA